MSKPRAQIGREAELELLRTLDKARAAATTLYRSEPGTVDRGNRVEDITFAPREDVQAEVKRLSSKFGLLLWTDNVVIMRSPDGGLTLSARFTLFHLDSGASKVFEFEGLCFPLSDSNNNAAWAGEASVSYAERNAGLRIFGIPVAKRSTTLTPAPLAAARPPTVAQLHRGTSYRPYTPEVMLEWLHLWEDHQREIAIASGVSESQHDIYVTSVGGALAQAWAECRRCTKAAGITIRPLMPGDKPVIDEEREELHEFLYAELLRDGLLTP